MKPTTAMQNRRPVYKGRLPLLMVLLLLLASCDSIIDLEESPQDRVPGDQVFQDEALIGALVADLYAGFPFNGFTNPNGGDIFDGVIGEHDLATERGNAFVGCRTHGGMNSNNDCEGLWNYQYIRDLNFFIESIREAPVGDSFKRQLEGEVRTLRAAVYYKMQRRYGGVPLVDVVLDPFGEIPEQYVVRSTEEAIADFIDTELQAAADMLPHSSVPTGRVNRWTAYAYKARVNLWSASIAKFGDVQLNGLVGIPANRADEFYRKASTAAQEVINSGQYSLLQGSDKARNYWRVFVEDENAEAIFEKKYDGVEVDHSFSHQNQPTPLSEGQGSEINPTLGHLQRFENIDGTFSNPPLGPDHLYEDGAAPWANKDPRLHGQVLLQGDVYAGVTIQSYEGLDPTTGGTNPDNVISENGIDYQGTPTVGEASRRQANHFFPSTGLLLYKYVDEIPLAGDDTESYNWKELRLGEMYLIAAESEFELGNAAGAAMYLNATRDRVGLIPLDASSITRERVRTERTSELVFEGHRWDDLRRWRIAQDMLDGQMVEGVRTILHHETGQFYFIPFGAEQVQRQFRPEHYYNPITNARIDRQGQLVENPGY